MKVVLLGTGTPQASLSRMGSGYLIDTGDDIIMFDHGPGAYQRMMEAGYNPSDINTLFFSHLHYDHCLDFQRLVLTRWDKSDGSTPELEVFSPAPMKAINEQLFGEGGVWHGDLEARTKHPMSMEVFERLGGVAPRARPSPNVVEYIDGHVAKGRNWTLTIREMWHAQPYLDCYGFRFETSCGVIAYTGDTGPCENAYKLADNAEVLIGMCTYESGTALKDEYRASCLGHMELAEIGQRSGAKKIVLTHIPQRIDSPPILERLIDEMQGIYSGKIVIGQDLMELKL